MPFVLASRNAGPQVAIDQRDEREHQQADRDDQDEGQSQREGEVEQPGQEPTPERSGFDVHAIPSGIDVGCGRSISGGDIASGR
jgi:hypothetical protein